MLQYVPIVKVTLVIFIQKKKKQNKKQKKKKKENDPYFGMGEKPKLCHKNPTIYLFSWKGRESLCLQTLHKKTQ